MCDGICGCLLALRHTHLRTLIFFVILLLLFLSFLTLFTVFLCVYDNSDERVKKKKTKKHIQIHTHICTLLFLFYFVTFNYIFSNTVVLFCTFEKKNTDKIKTNTMASQLPLYSSFDEDEGTICVLCKQSHDDPLELGDKFTYDNITFHLYCAVSLFSYHYIAETNHSKFIVWKFILCLLFISAVEFRLNAKGR